MAPELATGLDRVWALLARAVDDRTAPWRTPVVVAHGHDGPDGRLMVVRAVDRAAATLTFYTDVRAAKVAAIATTPSVAVVAWDPAEQLQLRMRGAATVTTAGPAADAAWAAVGHGGRRAYCTADAPGTAASSSAAAARPGDGDGRANFALLTVGITAVEWLDLAGGGHGRARYRPTGDGWGGEWCVP